MALRAAGIDESRPLDFHTPYGCSKGAADQYVARLCAQLRHADRRVADELHLRPAPDGHRGPGLGRPFPDPRARRTSRSRSTATADRSATSSTSAMRWTPTSPRSAASTECRGPRLQPRRRPGERGQPARTDRRDRAITSAATIELSFEDWRPGDQRWFVADTRPRAPRSACPSRAAGATASPSLPTGCASERGLQLHVAAARERGSNESPASAADDHRCRRRRLGLQPRARARACGRSASRRCWRSRARRRRAAQRERSAGIRAGRDRPAARMARHTTAGGDSPSAGDRLAATRRACSTSISCRPTAPRCSPTATSICPCVAVQHSCVASWWAAVRGTPLPRGLRAGAATSCARAAARADAVVAPSLAFAEATARIYGVAAAAPCTTAGTAGAVTAAARKATSCFTAGRLWDEGKNVATLDARRRR